jgi:hypothetical protein
MMKSTKMTVTPEGKTRFFKTKCWHICHKLWDNQVKVEDHDHRTGAFRGAAHVKCSINCEQVSASCFHYLKGYDCHLITGEAYKLKQAIQKYKDQEQIEGDEQDTDISAAPLNYEMFISFNIGGAKFIDSFQFMGSSLDNSTGNLYDQEDKYKHFNCITRGIPDNYELVCQTCFCLYEWVGG